MSGGGAAIRTVDLGKRYFRTSLAVPSRPLERLRFSPDAEPFWAFRHLDFEVRRGEVLGVVGPNGAGKSTLLRVLARITRPNEGFAELHGSVGTVLSVATGFHPEMTGRENVYLSAALLGMPPSEASAAFDEIVEDAGVPDWIDTPLKRYSTGMRVRLGFSIAARIPNDIVLVDEALAVGDESFRRQAIRTLIGRADHGAAVLLVGHQLALLEEACQRVLWLDEGRLRALGEAGEVLAAYRSATSA